MDSVIYRQIIGQINKSSTVPHCNFPSHNLLSMGILARISRDLNDPQYEANDENEFLSEIPCFQPFDYEIENCYPIYCSEGTVDVASSIIKRKIKWERKLKSIKIPDIKKAIQNIKNAKNNKRTTFSENLVKYIKHFEADPVPGFNGSYNWLYTGGNLSVSNINENLLLISADYVNNSSGLNVFQLGDSNNIDYKLACQLKKNSPIFQISSKVKQNDLFILVRQSNNMSLLKIDGMVNDFKKLWRKKVEDSKVLTSIDMREDCALIMAADSKCNLHVYDTETRDKVFNCGTRISTKDSWNQVMFVNDYAYIANRNFFYIFDIKDFYSQPILKYNPSEVTNDCEDICSIMKSSINSNYLYVATTHNLIQIDIRNGKNVQKWTHLMQNPPQFFNCVENDNNDFIVLQSSQVDETIGIKNEYINKGDNIDFHSKSLPFALTGLKESLKDAQMNGLCLSPFTVRRFDYSVTGIQCLKNYGNDVHLFTTNSVGDVFFSKITKKFYHRPRTAESKSKFLEKMKIFEIISEKALPEKLSKSSFGFVNMKNVLNDIRHSNEKYEYNKPKRFWKCEENFSEKSLSTYKDLLAQKILHVWGCEMDDSDLESSIPPEIKIEDYLGDIEGQK